MVIDSVLASLAVCCLTGLLGIAVLSDLRARRVSNRLVVLGLVLAFALQALADHARMPGLAGTTLLAPAIGAVLGGVSLLPLYVLRACGAGDVKLLAMVGAFIGPAHLPLAALYTMLAGGLLAVLWMMGSGIASATIANLAAMAGDLMARIGRVPRRPHDPPLQRTAARLPYALAIAAGTAASMLPALQLLP